MNIRVIFFFLTVSYALVTQGVSASVDGPFELVIGSYNKASEYIILKYNKESGEAWLKGEKGYESLPENQKIPESVYQIKITDFNQGWLAIRIDTRTGRTWTLKEGKWFELM
jgi:hypothetical protein